MTGGGGGGGVRVDVNDEVKFLCKLKKKKIGGGGGPMWGGERRSFCENSKKKS